MSDYEEGMPTNAARAGAISALVQKGFSYTTAQSIAVTFEDEGWTPPLVGLADSDPALQTEVRLLRVDWSAPVTKVTGARGREVVEGLTIREHREMVARLDQRIRDADKARHQVIELKSFMREVMHTEKARKDRD
jgi:hypothetical protein